MGTYIATMWLECDTPYNDVLARFNSFWTSNTAYSWMLMDFNGLDAPVNNAPDPDFTAALHDEILTKFRDEIAADLGLADPDHLQSVAAFDTWSPPAGSAPHEGGPSVVEARIDDGGGAYDEDWIITAGGAGHTGEVRVRVLWRYHA